MVNEFNMANFEQEKKQQMQKNLDCKLLPVLCLTSLFLIKSPFIMRARQRITV